MPYTLGLLKYLMKSIIEILLTISILFYSCTNVVHIKQDPTPKTYLEKINSLGKKYKSEVRLVQGEIVKAKYLEIKNDSLYILPAINPKIRKVPLTGVYWINIKDSKLGLGYGFFIGAGIGCLIGFAVGEGQEMGGLAVLGGIVAGGLVGSISGLLIGSSHDFQFHHQNK